MTKERVFIKLDKSDDGKYLFFVDHYFLVGRTLTPFNESVKLLKELNKFYSKQSKESIEKINLRIEAERREITKIEQDKVRMEMNAPNFKDSKPIKGYIYFLKAYDNIIKIGRAVNLKDRFDTISPQLPFETEVLFTIKVKDYIKAESLFHSYFNNKWVRGEWFNLTDEDIKNIKNKELPQDIVNLIIN